MLQGEVGVSGGSSAMAGCSLFPGPCWLDRWAVSKSWTRAVRNGDHTTWPKGGRGGPAPDNSHPPPFGLNSFTSLRREGTYLILPSVIVVHGQT